MKRAQGSTITLIGILFITWGICFLTRMSPLFLAPYLVKGLGLTSGKLGILAAGTGISWAASSLFFGALSDRAGRKIILIPAIFAFSFINVFSGCVHTYSQLLLVRILYGIAAGPCWTIITAIIKGAASPEHRGRDVGIVVNASSLVALGVGPILLTQIASHFNWRTAFIVAGVPGLIMGVIIWIFVREPAPEATKETMTEFKAYLSVLRHRNVWLACLGSVGLITCITNLNTFAPLYMTQAAHLTPTMAGWVFGIHGVAGFFYGFLGPAMSDRTGRKKAILLFSSVSVILPLLFLFPIAYVNLFLLMALVAITSVQMPLGSLVMVLVPSESAPKHLAGTAIGLASMVSDIVGATISPMLGGWMAEVQGPGFPLILAAAGVVIVFIAAACLKKSEMQGPDAGKAAALNRC